MGPAGCFDDPASFIERMKSSVSVGLKGSAEVLEMGLRMFSAPIGREGEPDRWRGGIGRRTAIAHIGPEPTGLGPSVAGCEHRNGCIVGMKSCRREHMMPHCLDQGFEQSGRGTDPSSERGAVEIDAFAGIDLRLPVQRRVIAILRHQHMRKQPGSGVGSRNRPGRRGRFDHRLTAAAAELRPHMADDLEALGHILEDFGDIFAELAQRASTTGAAARLRAMRLDLARQMFRQGATGRLFRLLLRRQMERQWRGYFLFPARCLQLFKLQLQLRDLPDELLALRSEEHPLELIEQQLEVSDLAGTRGKLFVLFTDERLHRFEIEVVESGDRGCGHRRSMPQNLIRLTAENPHEHWVKP
jgi:hypothetical protein